MKVMVIQIADEDLSTVLKDLEKEVEEMKIWDKINNPGHNIGKISENR